MKFSKEQIRDAYQKLPSSTRNFVADFEITDKIDEFLGKMGFTEEVFDLSNSQILYAMYGLQTLDQAISDIASISGKNVSELSALRDNLQKGIFANILVEEEETTSTEKTTVLDWRTRVEEIAKKYELGIFQRDGLISICSCIIDSKQDKDTSLSDLNHKLGVSGIVSDQILEDLDKRVFSLLEKEAQKAPVEVDKKRIVGSTVAEEPQTVVSDNTPDFIPANLPVSDEDRELIKEKVSIPKYVPTKVEAIKEEMDSKYEDLKMDTALKMQGSLDENPIVPQRPLQNSRITYKPAAMGVAQSTPQEFVQRVASVPRINLNEEAPVIESSPVGNIVDNKLGNTAPQATEVPTPKQEIPIVKSYTVDPYREPVE